MNEILLFLVLTLLFALVAAIVLAFIAYARTGELSKRVSRLEQRLRASHEPAEAPRPTRPSAPQPPAWVEPPERPPIPVRHVPAKMTPGEFVARQAEQPPASAPPPILMPASPVAPPPPPARSPEPARAVVPLRPLTPPPPMEPEVPTQPELEEVSAVEEAPVTPPRRVSLEERLGARMFVWIAGVALALAGAYLVKYSYQHDLISPPVRIGIAAAFGAAMLGAGEFMRKRSGRIGQALSAAGVAVLFTTLYAGVHYERLIEVRTGFVLMAAVAALAVFLSLRQGPFVAILGLLGGFTTPALMTTGEHAPGMLFSYLFVLQVGLIAVARMRRWWWLTLITTLGGFGWVWLWFLSGQFLPTDNLPLGVFLVASVAALILGPGNLAATDPTQPREAGRIVLEVARWTGIILGLVLTAVLLGKGRFTTLDWAFFAILGASCLVLARLYERYFPLAWVAAGLTAAMALGWFEQSLMADDRVRFAWTVMAMGILYGFGAYAALWKSRRAGAWACLSALSGVGAYLLAYTGLGREPLPHFWGLLSVGLAGVYAAMAWPLLRRRESEPGLSVAVAVLLVAASAFLAIAVPIELPLPSMVVAWSILVVAMILISQWLDVRAVRDVALLLGGWVVLCLLINNPIWVAYPVGPWPVINWILYRYGIPTAALALSAWLLHRRGDAVRGDVAIVYSVLTGLALVMLEVRQGFHAGSEQLGVGPGTLNELATYVIALLAVAPMLLAATRRTGETILGYVAVAVMSLGVAVYVALLLMMANPLMTAQELGHRPILNWLLYVYGVPAVLLAVSGWVMSRGSLRHLAPLPWIASLLAGLVLVFLQVRQGFNPEDSRLATGVMSLNESATYAIALLGAAAILLGAGWRLRKTALEYAGAAVAAGGVAFFLFYVVLGQNPLWVRHDLGHWYVINWLLYAFGVPALLMAGIGWLFSKTSLRATAPAAWIASLVAGIVFVTLEVRHGFHPRDISLGEDLAVLNEAASYPIALLLLGVMLLTVARSMRKSAVEYAGAAVAAIGAAAFVIFVLLAQNPLWVRHDLGPWAVVNWLVYAYGVPVLLMGAIGWLLSKGSLRAVSPVAWVAALAGAAVLVTLEVRQGFHRDDMRLIIGNFTLREWATYVIAWQAIGLMLLAAAVGRPNRLLSGAGGTVSALGVVIGAVGLLIPFNPMISGEAVGAVRVLNWLLYAYGLPAALLLGAASVLGRIDGLKRLVPVAQVLAMVFLFVLINLEVRQAFSGAVLSGSIPVKANDYAEMYSYSAAWVVFGAALLVLGIATGRQWLRWSSLVVVMLAVVKVFVLDMSELRDLYRVFSFLGLGVTLLVLAYLYQRFVFRRPPEVVAEA